MTKSSGRFAGRDTATAGADSAQQQQQRTPHDAILQSITTVDEDGAIGLDAQLYMCFDTLLRIWHGHLCVTLRPSGVTAPSAAALPASPSPPPPLLLRVDSIDCR